MIKSIIIFLVTIVIVYGIYSWQSQPAEELIELSNSMETSNINQEKLKIEVLQEGTGQIAENGQVVTAHYTGTLEDGTKFDSSLDRGQPISFILGAGKVIKGWDQGILGMKVGEKRKLTIASELAYGAAGIPGAIPPNATLIFEVELLGVE